MKTIFYSLFLCFCSVWLFSCDKEMAVNNDCTQQINHDKLKRSEFNAYKSTWDNNYRAYFAKDSLHYFDVPLCDLKAILNEGLKGSETARFYMGMTQDQNNRLSPHLMLVGVNADSTSNYSLMVDYTRACPIICPGGNGGN